MTLKVILNQCLGRYSIYLLKCDNDENNLIIVTV